MLSMGPSRRNPSLRRGVLTQCSKIFKMCGVKQVPHSLERRLAALPVPMAAQLPAGQPLGARDPARDQHHGQRVLARARSMAAHTLAYDARQAACERGAARHGTCGPGDDGYRKPAPHHARALWVWSDRLEAQLPAARDVLRAHSGADQGDKVLRAYRLYLAGSALGIERGWMALHLVLAIKPDGNAATGMTPGAQSGYPFTRDYIYAPRSIQKDTSPCSTSSNPAPPPT
jgi:hypothetical protein